MPRLRNSQSMILFKVEQTSAICKAAEFFDDLRSQSRAADNLRLRVVPAETETHGRTGTPFVKPHRRQHVTRLHRRRGARASRAHRHAVQIHVIQKRRVVDPFKTKIDNGRRQFSPSPLSVAAGTLANISFKNSFLSAAIFALFSAIPFTFFSYAAASPPRRAR